MSTVVAGAGELSERVMALVAQHTGRERAVITPETDIERDLGCSIVEARALMERLEAELEIDMAGFDPDRHFDSAGSLLWPIGVSLVVALPLAVLIMLTLGSTLMSWGLVSARAAAGGGLFLLAYFGSVLVVGLVTTILPALRMRGREKIPVTVQMLIEAAVLRHWPASFEKGAPQ